MRMTMPEKIWEQLRTLPGLWRLSGRVRDNGDVIQVLAASGEGEVSTDLGQELSDLGSAFVDATIDAALFGAKPVDDWPEYLIETAEPMVMVRQGGEYVYGELDVIRPTADFFARTAGVLDSDLLRDKSVAIVGLGTGGSLLAVEMARCGVGRLVLVDYDRLETHNIARHVCGLRDVGRLKTLAVKDVVVEKSPYVVVETHEFDILQNPALLAEIMSTVDLVLAATDTEGSKILINRISLAVGVPVIYGGAYERAMGGDVIKVVPGKTPCYDCVIGQVVEELGQPGGGAIDYSAIQDPAEVQAVPGLGLDVSFIALIQAKLALWTLLESVGCETPTVEANYILWGNRPEWIFTQPFQCVLARTEKRAACPSCGWNLSADEIHNRVKRILDEAE